MARNPSTALRNLPGRYLPRAPCRAVCDRV